MKKLLLLLFLFTYIFNFAQEGVIKGRIFNDKNNEAVPFANIIIYGTTIGTTTDLDGNFEFKGIKPGFVRLAASSVGFKPYVSADFMVTNANAVYFEIPMQETSIELEDVVIKASPFRRIEESPVSMRTLNISEIERNPGGNRDISKIISTLPGVASTVSFRNDVIVRGGGISENKFYLDGIEIPTINHFSTQGASGGPIGMINVDFIREVDFYSGAFPADRSNTLSSVLDFKLIEPNKDKTNFKITVGASDLALAINTPISDNSSLLFSFRRSYLQYIFSVIGLPFLPTYNDLQFKYQLKLSNTEEISLIGIGALDKSELNLDIKEPDESQRYILGYLPVSEQWNYTLGIKYRKYRKNGYHQFVLSNSHLNNVNYKYQDNIETESNKLYDYLSTENETKFRFEHLSRINEWKITYGINLENGKYTNSTFQKVFRNGISQNIDYQSDLSLYKWGLFSQLSKNLVNDRLVLSFGLRTDANNYSDQMSNMLDQFSPRFSASWSLTPKYFLNFNTGIYYQHPSYTTLGYRDNSGELSNKENGLKYIRSSHIVAGIEYQPRNSARITLEGFYKDYGNYPFSLNDSIALANKGGGFGVVGDEEVISIGKGRAYGFEFYAREKMYKGFNLIFSYTFVRSEFKNYDNQYIPSAWDNKHLLNIVLLKEFKNNWDIGLKWRFVGGSPYTPYDLVTSAKRPAWDVSNQAYLDYSRFNSLRYSSFHQLDVRIDKQFFYRKWSLMLYIDVQNIYNYSADEQNYLTNLNEQGIPQIADPSLPYAQQEYILREIETSAGTVFPTIGIIVEF